MHLQFQGTYPTGTGIHAAFDENTTDIRINQYEAGLHNQKEEILTSIADALEVNYRSFYEPTSYAADDIMYTLFEMDEHFLTSACMKSAMRTSLPASTTSFRSAILWRTVSSRSRICAKKN